MNTCACLLTQSHITGGLPCSISVANPVQAVIHNHFLVPKPNMHAYSVQKRYSCASAGLRHAISNRGANFQFSDYVYQGRTPTRPGCPISSIAHSSKSIRCCDDGDVLPISFADLCLELTDTRVVDVCGTCMLQKVHVTSSRTAR